MHAVPMHGTYLLVNNLNGGSALWPWAMRTLGCKGRWGCGQGHPRVRTCHAHGECRYRRRRVLARAVACAARGCALPFYGHITARPTTRLRSAGAATRPTAMGGWAGWRALVCFPRAGPAAAGPVACHGHKRGTSSCAIPSGEFAGGWVRQRANYANGQSLLAWPWLRGQFS